MLLENVFVHEDFLSTVKKLVIENKQALGALMQKTSPPRILEI